MCDRHAVRSFIYILKVDGFLDPLVLILYENANEPHRWLGRNIFIIIIIIKIISVLRGMQGLCSSIYIDSASSSLTIPVMELGVGAWNNSRITPTAEQVSRHVGIALCIQRTPTSRWTLLLPYGLVSSACLMCK